MCSASALIYECHQRRRDAKDNPKNRPRLEESAAR